MNPAKKYYCEIGFKFKDDRYPFFCNRNLFRHITTNKTTVPDCK